MDWIPNYIRKNIQYKPHEVLTAKEFNALLNLLITQGDYNSSWLEYIHTEGIPNAVAALNNDQIEKVLKEIVEAEIGAIAASVVNKSSVRLETPVFAFLNLSIQADMEQFRTVVENFEVPGSFCIATNFVGASAAFPTLVTMQAMRVAGHDVLPVGTDGSPYETASVSEINTALERTKAYMRNNLKDTDVFVYPGGTTSQTVVDTVGASYTYAINTALPQSNLESDDLRTDDTRVQLPVLLINDVNTLNTGDVKNIIDDAIVYNRCCIIAVDTSSTNYSEDALIEVMEYITAHAGITCTTASNAINLCATTINNQLRELYYKLATEVVDRQNAIQAVTDALNATEAHIKTEVLQNCYVTTVDVEDEQGNTVTEKYLNW